MMYANLDTGKEIATDYGATFRIFFRCSISPEISAFVASLTYGAEPEPMTIEDAEYNLQEYRAAGMDLPAGITARKLAAEWNRQIQKGA